MQVAQIETETPTPLCHKQALVESIARGNPHAAEELRLLLKIRCPETTGRWEKR